MSNNYVIVSESTGDLSPEMIQALDLTIIPMEFEVEGKRYLNYPDGRELGFKEFYDMLREGKTSATAQVNPGKFVEVFTPILEEGKDILYMAFSSGLSGTYNASLLAVEELKEKYPDRKIYSVDTLCTSMGEGLIVFYAANMKKEGKTIDEVLSWIKENRLNVCHWFTVDDLKHLHRGGRVSATSAIIGTMLGIKPVLHVDDEGHLINMEKVRGRMASLKMMFQRLDERILNPEGQSIFISHGDSYDDACALRDMIMEKYGKQIKEVCLNYIGPVVGSHSGPGTIALFFLGTKR